MDTSSVCGNRQGFGGMDFALKAKHHLRRAFDGDGGTCECRGGCPPGPPSVVW